MKQREASSQQTKLKTETTQKARGTLDGMLHNIHFVFTEKHPGISLSTHLYLTSIISCIQFGIMDLGEEKPKT